MGISKITELMAIQVNEDWCTTWMQFKAVLITLGTLLLHDNSKGRKYLSA